ncbi:fibronectin type III domain-containing protein [Geomesophilobacter sediminis]|uniref:Fibronectin type III domain-containing protein n=1 Tax=Geomesophilobacter sediminis TaxID=2798584 RepID=A0A8J7IWV3_9BACT|nr:fibronectin type III domain-containing protein [Geomesophilobacter sediminis]MBJ6724157.1 fibronectin type III domain-containing protein [Geomesophilobacter sediminis]
MNATDRFLMNHVDMNPPELIIWLNDAATLQEAHPRISAEKDHWVPGAQQFREHKETISREWEKAGSLNVTWTKELEAATAAALEDVNINANYLVLRAKHAKDESWLHNNGYNWREKSKKSYDRTVSMVALSLRLKNGPEIGEVTAAWGKDSGAGSYQLQFCKGIPQGEESFVDQGFYKRIRAVVGNLERACWYYFRVRSIGNNMTSPWSEAVGIIVT